MTPQATVEAFIAAWNEMNIPAALAMMSEDAVWHNMPLNPAKGIAEITALLEQFPAADAIEFVTHQIAANGNVVLTERTDRFLIGGRWRELKVMGAFEIDNQGRITAWRDYFDLAEMQREFA